MAAHTLTPAAAWKKCAEFLSLPEVKLPQNRQGLDEQLGKVLRFGADSPNLWTDAYLAAFSRCAGLRLVTFDQGFSRFAGLDLLLLRGP